MKKTLARLSHVFFFMVILLTACGEDHLRGLQKDIDAKKKAVIENQEKKLPMTMQRFAPMRYMESSRNPFEVAVEMGKVQKELTPLNMYGLATLQFVGTITEGNKKSAIIVTPDNLNYTVKVGDSIGDHYGRIIAIEQSQIKIMETFAESGKDSVDRIVTLQLKDER